jgi:pyrimidine-nucleoside phosphorylase
VNFLACIEAKRDGKALSREQLASVVVDYTRGVIPDYQMAAFLMAVYFRGLDRDETTALTCAMRDSGERLEWPQDTRPLVDKHSTGGVGDKVSLPLAPLLACLGFRVPMVSGRGLGITGGTLDKLESIPGFQALLPPTRIREIVQQVGCVICGQTENMVPADKMLYALRDVTATVPSIPLIVASILSKKLAEGLDALVLDVKFGGAAFMPTIEQARTLAEHMVCLAAECGVKTSAFLTRMDTPLGAAAGNWLEVKESVSCLEGQGPPDLRELVIEIAAQTLMLAGKTASMDVGRIQAEECLSSGAPRRKFDEMIAAQGADLGGFHQQLAKDTLASGVLELLADRDGCVARCDARMIGELIRDLGGGRLTKDSRLDWSVGVDRLVKCGQKVRRGDLLGRVHHSGTISVDETRDRFLAAFTIRDDASEPGELIAERLG